MCTSMSVNINYRFKFFNNNVSWKKQDDQAYKNANVPVNVFSGQGSGIFVPFKAQPLKNTYRKSLNFSNNYSSTQGTTIKDAIDNPGAAPVSKVDCDECSNNHIIQHNKKTNTQTLKELAANNPEQTNYEMAPFFPDITNSNKKLNETIRRIIYHDHLYYQEAKDAVVRHKIGHFPSLKEMTQNAYIQNQKQSRKKTLVDSGMISGFTSGIRYKDPNNRGTIDTESAVWNKVKNEITSVASNRDDFNKIQNDIVDNKKNITRSYNNFFRDYQIKYNNLSLPIEQQLESSEREKARIQAATYPSRDIVTDGMSNMMKEGMSIIDKEKRKDKKCIKATCKYESSSYPNIYK